MIENLIRSQNEITNTLKLLIYKETPLILEKVDFENDNIFLEPLLFVYFNYTKFDIFPPNMLHILMQGYFIDKESSVLHQQIYNNDGIAYIPNVGYFKINDNEPFDRIELIPNTNIEIIKHQINLFDTVFNFIDNEIGNFKIKEIEFNYQLIEKNWVFLTKAFQLIKENSKEHYKLIEQCCKKILLFKTNPENTNSFATINAHGTAFINVYQSSYKLVFFIDDIAHQTGHIILTSLFYNRKSIFKIDENQNIGKILLDNDYRSFYTLIHALYTYYTTFLCLDDCLKSNSLNSLEKEEAIGRIGFYLIKCTIDIKKFNKIISYYNGIENVLTFNGIEIYKLIFEKYTDINCRRYNTTANFNFTNQPYNFTFDIYLEDNKKN
jgi:hypothetical protein